MKAVVQDGIGIDIDKLAREVKRKRIREDIGQREVGNVVGCSASTVGRVEAKKRDLEGRNLVGLARWLGMPTESFFSYYSYSIVYYENPDFRQFITAVLYADKTLSQKTREALIDLMIVAYENFTE